MPEVPQLSNCCFFFTTETGSKIIGWVTTILSILGVLEFTVELIGLLGSKNKQSGALTDCAITLAMYVLLALLGIYLLIGVYQKNMAYVKLWVGVTTIHLIVLLILVVIGIVLAITGRGKGNIIQLVLTILFEGYFVLVVYSFYREGVSGGSGTY